MHTVNYGFNANLRRSGHAACWCPPLNAVVQFGGWPPSEALSRVVQVEGTRCPLYYLTAQELLRGTQRANTQQQQKEYLDFARSGDGDQEANNINSAISSSSSGASSEDPYEGYLSEPEDFLQGAEEGPASSTSSYSDDDNSNNNNNNNSNTNSPPPQPRRVAAVMTVESLRDLHAAEMLNALAVGESTVRREDDDGASTVFTANAPTISHASMFKSSMTAMTESDLPIVLQRNTAYRDAGPILQDTCVIKGKYDTQPLHWHAIRPIVAPRTRHGHHLLYHSGCLYVIGGSYWAHGNALATTDMCFDVATRVWQQLNPLLPSRFCSAVGTSNVFSPDSGEGNDGTSTTAMVVYSFGGLDFNRSLTSTLHRLWLPSGALEELPQFGASPRYQFKGTLICDVQEEQSPHARQAGALATGRLFYMDGFQEGRPMAPALRSYNLATGVWTKVCSCPDLVRCQVSLKHYETIDGVPHLIRFDVMGGMPSRRGKQRRSRMVFSYDVAEQFFDYAHALAVPGLTAHTVVELPADCPAAFQLRKRLGVTAVSCGGNEDVNAEEQNSLGDPVSWVYLLSLRNISLQERVRVGMERMKIPYRVLLATKKDDLLDELF